LQNQLATKGTLPPGLQKQLATKGTLPPGLAKRSGVVVGAQGQVNVQGAQPRAAQRGATPTTQPPAAVKKPPQP
jgi:hypothetical protein